MLRCKKKKKIKRKNKDGKKVNSIYVKAYMPFKYAKKW